MTEIEYLQSSYSSTINKGSDVKLTVEKFCGSDWARLRGESGGSLTGNIIIKSKQEAELLHFMLGQLIGKV